MAGIWPDYDEYATKTDRKIPLVVLEPADSLLSAAGPAVHSPRRGDVAER